MDTSRVSRGLEFDDHEAVLVGNWVRTGLWLQPHVTDMLDVWLASAPQPARGSFEHPGLAGSTHPAAPAGSTSSRSRPTAATAAEQRHFRRKVRTHVALCDSP